MDPMVGIYTAMTRSNLDGSDRWVPEETVDLATAIRAYTMGGASVVGVEDRRGSITAGKQADIVVLSEDLPAAADADPRRVLDVRVTHTIVGGEVVYRAA
jgi:predicted amidohydrolase YtcJ